MAYKTQISRNSSNEAILVDTQGLQDLLQCGRHMAWRIAEQADAVVYLGKLKRANVNKVRKYLENVERV